MKLILLLIPLLFFITSCSIDWNDEKEYEIRCTNNYTQEQSGNTFSSTESCLKEACNKGFTGGTFEGIKTNIEKIKGPINICNSEIS